MIRVGGISSNKNYNLKRVNRVSKTERVKAYSSHEDSNKKDSKNNHSDKDFKDIFERTISEEKVKKMKMK